MQSSLIKERTTINNGLLRSKSIYSKSYKRELEDLLNYSIRNLKYTSKRQTNYVNKMNETINILNSIPSFILSNITSHRFYISIRNIIRDILLDWYSSYILTQEEIYLLRNCIIFFYRLINSVKDITKLTSWLLDRSFINTLAKCMNDIDRLLYFDKENKIFEQLSNLFNIFSKVYRRLPSKLQYENEFYRLFEATMDCLISSNYDREFRKFKTNIQSMTIKQNFFLIQCPSFFTIYHGSYSNEVIEQLLDTMVPRYASILDKHIQSIKQWKSSMIHIVHHVLLTITHAKGYYTPYANGQPLQWLIDDIIRIISEPCLLKKVNEKGTTSETILINSALFTLTTFVHEPDLLAYIKQLKKISLFNSLVSSSNESIVIYAYMMLAYILEEDDIKSSEKDTGRLLSNIFDLLRKNIKSLSKRKQHNEFIERNISLLVESIHVLLQHDQIKSEILKQNALSLLINNYQHFNDRLKRLLLESIGSITFDEEAAGRLRDNIQFINSIENMQKSSDDGIKKAAEKIIWNLFTESEKVAQQKEKIIKKSIDSIDKPEEQDKSKVEEYLYDIMISYCHADQQLVNKIHKFLIDKGFKIWVDRDNMYGPAMEAMANAVENSEFVIICMSDSYKRSVYCQAEAEYAFRCKRRLLPIIVRQGYRADGWLGLLIGSRIYVDFGRLEFTKACTLLLKEITLQRESQLNNNTIGNHSLHENHSNLIESKLSDKNNSTTLKINESMEKSKLPNKYFKRNTKKSTYSSISIKQWTKKDVLDFLYDSNLHNMMPLCEFMTGCGLIKFYQMCQTSPTRLYNQLNEELTSQYDGLRLPIGIFTQFLSEMDQLTRSSSVSPIQAIEQDAIRSQSISPSQSSKSPSSPIISKRNSNTSTNSTSLLKSPIKSVVQYNSISPSQDITSPNFATIQTSCNVHITERTTYQTKSIVSPTINHVV
ncbi:unnamed protein product [Rotaria sp. Silwood1]|nr:unnamed protein product [Rotaria sp. Silwood1]CAF1313502.1 unnamed protein product [Rotaria sp. Silwood1]CAF3491901.1 unnamed protein product [Rotaria sp. Silwood1]CAF4590983.1 unnamed protein product [Rotaria sp. Silwood1]